MKGITVPYKDSIRKKRPPSMVLIKLRCGGVVMISLLPVWMMEMIAFQTMTHDMRLFPRRIARARRLSVIR
jgi:hypothetical protein